MKRRRTWKRCTGCKRRETKHSLWLVRFVQLLLPCSAAECWVVSSDLEPPLWHHHLTESGDLPDLNATLSVNTEPQVSMSCQSNRTVCVCVCVCVYPGLGCLLPVSERTELPCRPDQGSYPSPAHRHTGESGGWSDERGWNSGQVTWPRWVWCQLFYFPPDIFWCNIIIATHQSPSFAAQLCTSQNTKLQHLSLK